MLLHLLVLWDKLKYMSRAPAERLQLDREDAVYRPLGEVSLLRVVSRQHLPPTLAESEVSDATAEARTLPEWGKIESWLTDRELQMVQLREVQRLTMKEIGAHTGISTKRVHDIYRDAMKDLLINPAVVIPRDIPVITNPYFPYLEHWQGIEACPLIALPSPEQVLERNAEVFNKHTPQLDPVEVRWLQGDLGKELAERLFTAQWLQSNGLHR